MKIIETEKPLPSKDVNRETVLANFKAELLEENINVSSLFKKYVIDSPSYYFLHISPEKGLQEQIRIEIAEYFGVKIENIYFVGSSQLGFSLNPKNLFNAFDSKFEKTGERRDKSDIDVAIISSELFYNLGRQTFEYTNYYKDKWNRNEYYDRETAKQIFKVPLNYKFFEYYTKGWYRPDFKPQGFEFSLPKIYEMFKKIMYKKVRRKVSFGIYQDWYYFEKYHLQTLTNLRNQIKTEVL